MQDTYALLDSGEGRKLERYGAYTICRPASQAIWKPSLPTSEWNKADGVFTREGHYRWMKRLPGKWTVNLSGIKFLLETTSFGHLGLFPEHQELWEWMTSKISYGMKVLNLFAYSGGATLAAAKAGAEVCHVDASKGMVAWARENAVLNHLENKPIRWIVDDARKFLHRELRRNRRYDGILLDPPTYGRGSKGQVFKFEKDVYSLLKQCQELKPSFLVLSCHAPNMTPLCLYHLLSQVIGKDVEGVDCGELTLKGTPDAKALPTGSFARWNHG